MAKKIFNVFCNYKNGHCYEVEILYCDMIRRFKERANSGELKYEHVYSVYRQSKSYAGKEILAGIYWVSGDNLYFDVQSFRDGQNIAVSMRKPTINMGKICVIFPDPVCDDDKPFYMVLNTRNAQTRKRHESIESASIEARRLSKKHPDDEFIVLKAISSVKTKVEKTTEEKCFE